LRDFGDVGVEGDNSISRYYGWSLIQQLSYMPRLTSLCLIASRLIVIIRVLRRWSTSPPMTCELAQSSVSSQVQSYPPDMIDDPPFEPSESYAVATPRVPASAVAAVQVHEPKPSKTNIHRVIQSVKNKFCFVQAGKFASKLMFLICLLSD